MTLRNIFAAKMAAAALAIGVAGQATAVFAADENAVQGKPASVAAAASTKATYDITFDPLLPPPVIFGALAAFLALSLASRRMRGSYLRAATGTMIAGAMLNPGVLRQDREQLPTEIVVLVDKSPSQSLDGRDITTAAAQADLLGKLKKIDGLNVRVVDVGAARGRMAADGTNLFTPLDELSDLRRDHVGAVFVLTDGRIADIPAPEAWGFAAPLHVLVSGRDGEQDRRIIIDQSPYSAEVKKTESLVRAADAKGASEAKPVIKFHVADDGRAGSLEKVRVVLRIDGKDVETRAVTPGAAVEMPLTIAHSGANVVELQAETLKGELTDVNNRIITEVKGIRPNLNVLYFSGSPNLGVQMWRGLFKSDPDTNLIQFTALRGPLKQDDTPVSQLSLLPFPMETLFTEKLDDFDLVVMDHFENNGLIPSHYFPNIAEYVKKGGTLLIAVGPEYAGERSLANSPLGEILPGKPTGPVTDDSFRPAVSEKGKRHPVTRDLPGNPALWGSWFHQVTITASPSATVVLEGANKKPLLVLERKGEGRVATLLSDQAWLWMRGYQGGGPATELLQRTARWLIKNPEMDEEALRMTPAETGDSFVVEQQSMADKNAAVIVRTPSGKTQSVVMTPAGAGLWRGIVQPEEAGQYSAEQAGKNPLKTFTSFGLSNPKEFAETISTLALVKPLVEKTGGLAARMNDGAGTLNMPRVELRARDAKDKSLAGKDWMGIRESGEGVLKSIERTSLEYFTLPLIMLLLGATFAREADHKWLRAETWKRDGKRMPLPGSGGPGV